MADLYCSRCKQTKDENEFRVHRKRKRGRQAWCKVCVKEYDRLRWQADNSRLLSLRHKRRDDYQDWYKEYKSRLACIRCGENHIACLKFHHRDGSTKEINVSDAVRLGWSKKRVLAEIAKCDVLCGNCHDKLHWEERNAGTGVNS